MKSLFFGFVVIIFLVNLLNINFRLNGKINKKPKISVAKSGMINKTAPKAIDAPDNTSYVGDKLFFN